MLSYGLAPPNYRLPDAAHIGPVHLQVSDLARSIAYYENVLGMRVLRQLGGDATLGADVDDRPLIHLRERAGARPVPRAGRFGLYHFAILLPDRAALGRFLRHLASIDEPFGASDHLVSEALYLHDPDGLGIEVYADRPRDTWRIDERRQLHMTVDPLDVDDIIASAGGVAWTGLPAGTVMGHVHLHVGDLAAAEKFFHAGLGFDKMVWEFRGALFLSAGGYHHHLATNTWSRGPSAADDEARLLAWDLVVPGRDDADAVARSLQEHGGSPSMIDNGWIVKDPWGTPVRVVVG